MWENTQRCQNSASKGSSPRTARPRPLCRAILGSRSTQTGWRDDGSQQLQQRRTWGLFQQCPWLALQQQRLRNSTRAGLPLCRETPTSWEGRRRSVVTGTPEQLLAACSGLAAAVGSALVRTDCSGCTSRRSPEDLDTHAASAWLRNVPLVHFAFYQVK